MTDASVTGKRSGRHGTQDQDSDRSYQHDRGRSDIPVLDADVRADRADEVKDTDRRHDLHRLRVPHERCEAGCDESQSKEAGTMVVAMNT